MEPFSALLALCAGNSPASDEFPAQRPVTRSFDVFFDLRVNKRISKQSWGWWFETLSRSLWRHRNDYDGGNFSPCIHMPHAQDGVIKWKYFQRYWPFMRGIHRWPVNDHGDKNHCLWKGVWSIETNRLWKFDVNMFWSLDGLQFHIMVFVFHCLWRSLPVNQMRCCQSNMPDPLNGHFLVRSQGSWHWLRMTYRHNCILFHHTCHHCYMLCCCISCVPCTITPYQRNDMVSWARENAEKNTLCKLIDRIFCFLSAFAVFLLMWWKIFTTSVTSHELHGISCYRQFECLYII